MKISKMFHWLYAFLMFLPLFFVLGKGLYVTFNQNAKDSYYGETINEVNYVQVMSIADMKPGNYLFNNDLIPVQNTRGTFRLNISNFSSSTTNFNQVPNNLRFYSYPTGSEPTILYLAYYLDQALIGSTSLAIQSVQFTFTLESYTYQNSSYDLFLPYFYHIEYNNFSYLDNAIDYGMYELNESVLFAWAKDSFLSVPITYISSLFNMPTDSAIITALSYWLNISIIWLTFDVIMYVPLLAHRWLDKGVRE